MPASTVLKTKRDLVIKFGETGAWNTSCAEQVGPEIMTLTCDEGISISGGGYAINAYLDRGSFGSTPKLRKGDDRPFQISFTVKMTEFYDASAPTPMDLFLDTGFVGSDWVSTLGSNAEVKAFQLYVGAEGSDHGDATDHALVWNSVTVDACDFSEGDFNEWSMTVTCHEPTPYGVL